MKKQTGISIALASVAVSVSAGLLSLNQIHQNDFAAMHEGSDAAEVSTVQGSHVHHNPLESPRKNFDSHAGERVQLGTMEFSGVSIAATRVGALGESSIATIEFAVTDGTGPRNFRAWIGVESVPAESQAIVMSDDLNRGAHTHLVDDADSIPFLHVAVFDKDSMQDVVKTLSLNPKK